MKYTKRQLYSIIQRDGIGPALNKIYFKDIRSISVRRAWHTAQAQIEGIMEYLESETKQH